MKITVPSAHKNRSDRREQLTIDSFPSSEEELSIFAKEVLTLGKDPLSSRMLRVIRIEDMVEFWGGVLRDRSEGGERVRTFFQRTFEKDLKAGRKMFARKLILARPPQSLSVLTYEFPHFERAGVIETLRQDLILSRLSGGVLSIAPILLKSAPGIGKNRFARRLKEVLGITKSRTLDFSSSTSGWALSGMNSSWATSKPGEVFQTLTPIDGIGNPLFFLDEIEKGSVSSNASRPIECLHALTEAETAREFCDEFCPVPIDASRVIWVGAANSFEGIPDSILSRFRIFEIPSPLPAEKRWIAKSVWDDLITLNPWGKHLSDTLSQEVLDHFELESPRSIKRILRAAAASALSRTGGHIPMEKIQISKKDLMIQATNTIRKRPVGFSVADSP